MISKRAALAALAAIVASGQAHAAVTISTAATQNMNCSGGVCTPTAKGAVLNASDLQNYLSQFGNVRVMTTGSGVEANNIVVSAAFASPDSTSLTLEAHEAITINAAVSIGSGTSELELQSDTLAAPYTLSFGRKGHITFYSLSDIFGINGGIFTLVNSVQGLASAVAANPSGAYALANNYNASKDGTYSAAPVATTFEGTFEGLGNKISNLQISDSVNDNPVGLFAYIDTPASVLNLRLIKANIVGAQLPVGILAGDSNGFLFGDTTDGTIRASLGGGGLIGLGGAANGTTTILQCKSAANVQSTEAAGGLVGFMSGTITDSYASGTVYASDGSYYGAGGLVGWWNKGSITGSFATGAVSAGGGNARKYRAHTGGLIGFVYVGDSLANSYATGSVTGGTYSYVGGLVGYNYAGQSSGTSVTDSYATGPLSGEKVGGLVGGDWRHNDCKCYSDTYWDTDTSGVTNPHRGVGNVYNEPSVTGLTTAEFQSGVPTGFDPKIWTENSSVNNGLPYLIANPPPK